MEPSPRKPPVSADDFFSIDIRVGRVLKAECFPEARKPAYKLLVDFGPAGTLTTSAQVTHYRAESLVGRMVVGAVNIGERVVADFRSQFLLLGAMGGDGVVRLLCPDQGAAPGEPIA